VVRSVFEWRFCGAVGSVGRSFGDHGYGDLVFCDYYGVIYGCIWGAKVLRWDFLGVGRWERGVANLLETLGVG
jgi:hypothetical protein